MRTVLIVDDEPLVQVGLQTMVDWAAWGARLLPPASNGEVALQAIVEHHPDVVFTDIRMPLMDGLELIRRCRAEVSPCPEFVVLTSFADFSYAREAVKYEVVDYLIKLEINAEVLSQAFAKACRRLDAVQRPVRVEPEAGPLDRLTDLVQRPFATDAEAVAHLGGGMPTGDWFSVAVFQGSEGDPDQGPYARRLLREVLSREYRVYDISPGAGRFGFVLAGEASAAAGVQASVAQALELGRRYFNGLVLGGLGPLVPSLTGLSGSFRGALAALEGASDQGPLVADSSSEPGLTGEALRAELERALETQDPQAVHRVLDRGRAQALARGRLPDALELATAAHYGVLAVLPGGEDLLARWFAGGGAKVLYAIPTPEHVVSWMTTLEAGLVDHLQNLRSRPQEALVEAMRLHAQTHHRERVSLKEVAALFRLSPNYAGALFRRHTGKGYAEYVCEVKAAKARELLETGKYRVYEVSDLLGFENAYSFSKVFRRVTGKSPRWFLPHGSDS